MIGLVYQVRKEFFQILAGIVDFVHVNIGLNEGFDNDFNIVSLSEDMDFSILIDDLDAVMELILDQLTRKGYADLS